MDEAYSIYRILENRLNRPDLREDTASYPTLIVDSQGNEVVFNRQHSDRQLYTQDFPRTEEDCLFVGSNMDKGECLMRCEHDHHCGVDSKCTTSTDTYGYTAKRCQPNKCTNNSQCMSGQCDTDRGVCLPKLCDNLDDPMCIQTPHYWVQGRSGLPPLDERYSGMY
jgi:hypothetical protein